MSPRCGLGSVRRVGDFRRGSGPRDRPGPGRHRARCAGTTGVRRGRSRSLRRSGRAWVMGTERCARRRGRRQESRVRDDADAEFDVGGDHQEAQPTRFKAQWLDWTTRRWPRCLLPLPLCPFRSVSRPDIIHSRGWQPRIRPFPALLRGQRACRRQRGPARLDEHPNRRHESIAAMTMTMTS